MAQGQALSTVSIAYHITNDIKYLNAAHKLFSTLYKNSETYWCIYLDNNYYYWIEEYPSQYACHVLNGFLVALWGLWDYYVVSNDENALVLFKASIKTFVDNYANWDAGINKSYYCKHGIDTNVEATPAYHLFHIQQIIGILNWFPIPELEIALLDYSN